MELERKSPGVVKAIIVIKLSDLVGVDDFVPYRLGSARPDPGSIPVWPHFSLPTDPDICQFTIHTAYLHEEIDGVSGVSGVSCRYTALEDFIGTGE